MRATTAWPASSWTSATTTRAPSSAKRRAVRLPMPLAAPVTIATLSFKRTVVSPPRLLRVRPHRTGPGAGVARAAGDRPPLAVDRLDQGPDVADGERPAAPGGGAFGREAGGVVHHERAAESHLPLRLHGAEHVDVPLVQEHLLELPGGAADVPEVHVGDL